MISMISEGVYNFRKWPGMVNKELGLGFQDIWSLGIKRAKEILHYEGDCKNYEDRIANGDFANYLHGNGIDIGGGRTA